MHFFERAERNRRWSVFDDIPWEKLDPGRNDEEGALLAETFLGVEMYLPDYVSGGLDLTRGMFGQAWYNTNWGYEELKHGLVLREYLVRSGQRSADEMRAFEMQVLGKSWTAPFQTTRQMTFYGAVQEQATFMLYRKQLERATARGDVVLERIYQLISKDEAAHADFYRRITDLELIEDRAGTIADMALVLRKFKMPGHDLIPEYERRTAKMREDGGVDRGVFFKEVMFPTLRKVGVTREEICKASARQRGAEGKETRE